MNTSLWSWGNAKQIRLQLNIHLTFGLEFEVSINFHIPCILRWVTCPDVIPLGCKCFVLTALCYILWRDADRDGWTASEAHKGMTDLSSGSTVALLYVHFFHFHFTEVKRALQKVRYHGLWWKTRDMLLLSLLKSHCNSLKKISCNYFSRASTDCLHNHRQYVYNVFPYFLTYQFKTTMIDIYIRR